MRWDKYFKGIYGGGIEDGLREVIKLLEVRLSKNLGFYLGIKFMSEIYF